MIPYRGIRLRGDLFVGSCEPFEPAEVLGAGSLKRASLRSCIEISRSQHPRAACKASFFAILSTMYINVEEEVAPACDFNTSARCSIRDACIYDYENYTGAIRVERRAAMVNTRGYSCVGLCHPALWLSLSFSLSLAHSLSHPVNYRLCPRASTLLVSIPNDRAKG